MWTVGCEHLSRIDDVAGVVKAWGRNTRLSLDMTILQLESLLLQGITCTTGIV